MKAITRRYFDSLKFPKPHILQRSVAKNASKEAIRYVKLYKKTLNSLENKHREMIRYTFLEPELLDWLKGQYSISTFYRVREQSIRSFIERFYQ